MSTHEQHIARVIELAHENIKRGIIREPRVYFDKITFPALATQIGYADADVFRNGEEYPVRIHALTAAMTSNSTGDERTVQRVGLRMMYHDHYYMERDFRPLPSWHNKSVAGPDALSFGQSSWKLHTPFVLSARDSMDIRAQIAAVTNVRSITFGMTGIGMESRRPYFKADTQDYDAANAPLPFDPEALRNDGDEPILITDITVHSSADSKSNNPQGDIRLAEISMRQVGNGTQATWMNGTIGSDDLCPATLLGRTVGRAIVHEFPGEGLLWEPGEGMKLEIQPIGLAAVATNILAVAILGTIEVS